MYHTLLFDLDGTLTNSAEGITKCVQYALQDAGIEEPDLNKLCKFIGPPLRASFEKYYGFTPHQAEKATQKYRERYHNIGIYENEAYPGILDLIRMQHAAKITMGIATGKPEVYAIPIAQRFGFAPYMQAIVGSSLDGHMDNKALVIAEALRRLNCNAPEEKPHVLLIGDRQEDVFAAHDNGIKCIGIGYGFGSRSELEKAGADYYAETISDLQNLLQKLNS